mgnify:CR=1 FL=1
MPWYNPLDWFRKPGKPESEVVLYCDNPQCKRPIEVESVAYNEGDKEVYHPGDCGLEAGASKAFRENAIVMGEIDYIGLDKAKRLFREKKLKQASRLEGKLTA